MLRDRKRAAHLFGFDYRFAMGVADHWIELTKDSVDEQWSMGKLWHELTNRRRSEATISYAPGSNVTALRENVEAVWKEVAPLNPINYEFLNSMVEAQYAEEAKQARLFGAFSALAAVIACLGLYGLASFSAERRTREIGMLQAMGARPAELRRAFLALGSLLGALGLVLVVGPYITRALGLGATREFQGLGHPGLVLSLQLVVSGFSHAQVPRRARILTNYSTGKTTKRSSS